MEVCRVQLLNLGQGLLPTISFTAQTTGQKSARVSWNHLRCQCSAQDIVDLGKLGHSSCLQF